MHLVRKRYNIYVYQDKKWHTEIIEKTTDIDHLLGGYLKNIKEYRKNADYDLNIPITENHVEQVLSWLERIMNRVIY